MKKKVLAWALRSGLAAHERDQARIDALEREVARLAVSARELDEAKAELYSYDKIFETQEAQIKSRQEQLDAMTAKYEAAIIDRNGHSIRAGFLEGDLESSDDEAECWKGEALRHRATIEALTTERDALDGRVQQMQAELEIRGIDPSLRDTVVIESFEVEKLKASLSRVTAERDDLRDRVDAFDPVVSHIRRESRDVVARLDEHINELKAELSEALTNNELLEGVIAALKEELAEARIGEVKG